MANLNEKTKFICGRNPLAKNNRPSFAHPEQQEAALWLTDGTVNTQRSGKAPYSGGVTEQGDLLSFQLDSDHLHLFSRTTTNSLGYPDEVTESDDAQWDSREELLSYGTSA